MGPTWTGQETSEQDMGLRRLVTIKSGEFHGMGNLPLVRRCICRRRENLHNAAILFLS